MIGKLSKLEKKNRRKIKKCSTILEKFEGIQTVEDPSRILLVGNGGLVNGIQYETLMQTFCAHGQIEDIMMIPNRPYAFIIYHCTESAVSAMQRLNGSSQVISDGATVHFYLSYINEVPDLSYSNYANHTLPPGLILVPDFVSPDEEQKLLESVVFEDDKAVSQSLKHRAVRHYGYEFKYGTNDVDKQSPLEVQIPVECKDILQRLVERGYLLELPDQLTVNRYLPKQGIPPHIDTHSAFEDGIVSLGLGSQVVMEFRHPSGKHCPVFLPRRSILIMTGESRYLWTHGISQRKTDIVPVKDGNDRQCLTLMERSTRTSFTFRKIRQGECSCGYSAVCNSKQAELKSKENITLTQEQAKRLEEEHVFRVYDRIADHFSCTRHKPWPEIAKFLESLPSGSLLFDVGCGNGKYLGRTPKLVEIGCDISSGLLGICHARGLQVFLANGLHLPVRSEIADACLSIAVLHHLSTQDRREQALSEIIRIMKPGGLALIYVWALEQEFSEVPSNYLKTSKTKTLLQSENKPLSPSASLSSCHLNDVEVLEGVILPIHENRTNFSQQDLLVPWHYKSPDDLSNVSTNITAATAFRFYHVFRQHELESYAKNIPGILIEKSYYDKGNWCMIVKKRE